METETKNAHVIYSGSFTNCDNKIPNKEILDAFTDHGINVDNLGKILSDNPSMASFTVEIKRNVGPSILPNKIKRLLAQYGRNWEQLKSNPSEQEQNVIKIYKTWVDIMGCKDKDMDLFEMFKFIHTHNCPINIEDNPTHPVMHYQVLAWKKKYMFTNNIGKLKPIYTGETQMMSDRAGPYTHIITNKTKPRHVDNSFSLKSLGSISFPNDISESLSSFYSDILDKRSINQEYSEDESSVDESIGYDTVDESIGYDIIPRNIYITFNNEDHKFKYPLLCKEIEYKADVEWPNLLKKTFGDNWDDFIVLKLNWNHMIPTDIEFLWFKNSVTLEVTGYKVYGKTIRIDSMEDLDNFNNDLKKMCAEKKMPLSMQMTKQDLQCISECHSDDDDLDDELCDLEISDNVDYDTKKHTCKSEDTDDNEMSDLEEEELINIFQ